MSLAILRLFLFLCLISIRDACAEPFKRIRLRKLVGDPAELIWSQNNVIATGKSTKAEFEFQDGTVVKLGSKTNFRFAPGTREMRLEQGVIFFHATEQAGVGWLRTAGGIWISGHDFEVRTGDKNE
jgi:ferric-dicitrate binding protein FerR (iron transport regulator)